MSSSIDTHAVGYAARFRQIFSQYKIIALLVAVALIWLYFWYATDGAFLTSRNISNLFRQMAITGMLALGMVFVIIAGEIDLSVGSLLGLLGGVAAILDISRHLPLPATIALVLLLGAAVGALNGLWVTWLRVPSFIVGLGGMLAYRGVLLGITGGSTIAPSSDAFVVIGQGYVSPATGNVLAVLILALLVFVTWRRRVARNRLELKINAMWVDATKLIAAGVALFVFVHVLNDYGGIPVPVLLLLGLLAVFSFIASQTVFGRRIYAIGSNIEATRLSGINVDRVRLAVFVLMGVMCAFAGLVNTARLAAGSPSAGTNGELDAIAACFIGGASMRGGVGTVHGALVGVLVMASLDNGMSMIDVDAYWQMIVKGLILVLAVWADVVSSGRRR
jgi:D-xylose transport system permease protein